MPEGDTVHLTAARQNAALAGRTLTGFELRVPRLAAVDLAGQTVREVVAVGKHLLHRISSPDGGGLSLHTHLKMEGAWRTVAPGARWPRPAHRARAVLTTPDVVAIGFDLGVVELVPTPEEHTVIGHLGPDLLGDWDEDAAAEAVRRLAAHPETPVYVALLEQRNLAGIGNVYANELCFVRGLLPTRPVGEAGDLRAIVDLARRMLRANRDRFTRSTTGDLRPGRRTWVYGRTGEPCRRCGTRLEGGELGRREGEERVVTWCPQCQT
jgi:endonuclease-8